MMNSRITAPSGESFTSRVQPLRALACPDEAPSEGVARRSSHPRRPPPLGHSTGETAGTAVGSFGSRSVTQAVAHASNDLPFARTITSLTLLIITGSGGRRTLHMQSVGRSSAPARSST